MKASNIALLMTVASLAIPAAAVAAPDPRAALNVEAATQNAGQPVAVNANPAVTVPQAAGVPIAIAADHSSRATLSIPVRGGANVEGATSVFNGASPDSSIAVQSTVDGVRALVDIAGPAAPEQYAFTAGGAAVSLAPQADGSITVLDGGGAQIGHIAPPWARDATGAQVPTHFEVNGTTITQVVNHAGAGYAYPIVADPFWDDAWNTAKCAASIGLVFFAGSKVYSAIKDLGGVWNAAKLAIHAGNIHDFASAWGAAGAAILGIDGIRKNCF